MGKKSGGGQSTVVEKNDPPAIVAPHLANLYGTANHWFQTGQGAGTYPGERNAQVPWNLAHSWNYSKALATDGNPLARIGTNTMEGIQNLDTFRTNPVSSGQMLRDNTWASGQHVKGNREASGAFLGENPYLRGMADAASRSMREDFMQSIAPSLASQFSAAGRTGSGSHVGAFTGAASKLAERLGDVRTNIYGGAYENERQRMAQAYEAERQRMFGAHEAERGAQRSLWSHAPEMQLRAAAMAPAYRGMQWMDANNLNQFGSQELDLRQQHIDRAIDRHNELREQPLQRLMAYSSILQGATPYMSSSQTTSNATKYNRLAGTLGGGLGGYALGAALTPAGMASFGPLGAAVGALGGLFG